MMRIADCASSITILVDLIQPASTFGCNVTAASTAVWAWNSAGNEILNSTFSIT